MLAGSITRRAAVPTHSAFQPANVQRRVHTARARLREEEPVYFNDLYESLMDRIQDNLNPTAVPKALPREETLLMLQNIKTKDHAQKAFKVLTNEFESIKELALNDWHIRKKYYTSLAVKAVKNDCPEVLQELLDNMEDLKVPTYFVKDLIAELGRRRASYSLLKQLLDTLVKKRGAQDVGVAHAYYELLTHCQRNKLRREAMELFESARSQGVTLSEGLMKYKASLEEAANSVAVKSDAAKADAQ